MSLDVYLTAVRPATVFDANITHNLGAIAEEAGLYMHLWRPEEIGIKKAAQLIDPLRCGIACLEAEPERFRKLEPDNKWGTYDDFLPWLKRYLEACQANPDADVSASR